ncbi:MAG: histidine kinase [Candidatus Yanofskybacteria bacterium CG10_big_fil_rev_8_21_14_0_10_36_16]|uniref:Histidine kinase n=1 Tax=Candidatus Yanofskybacteria bacterium CG10_big_fil_rev_8_21_14_0_10_36_16 TaxID=1975096 RepID=A0A2J0Q7K1_9BACT|nr:MAG: histidine kinase [Candidatus Yanofskybacteria bacterium CG10_big_fil_rev_8_21_14_0_10_36_16]
MKKNKIKFKKSSRSWRFRGNELRYVKEVLDSGFGSSTSGNMNQRLESEFTKRFGVKYAITSTSGTTTLNQALTAFGVGPGDEVIVPSITVVSCAFAVLYNRAKPVFADVDPDTFLMDPKDVERKITKKTKAIMPVHLYGQVCDMDAIMKIAKKYNLYVLEDCAQCYLGTDEKGRIGGTIGDVGSFSFENSKHLSTGDGGILITNNEKFAERMRKFGCLGYKNVKAVNGQVRKGKDSFQDPKYERHDSLGWNHRLPEVAAAVGLAQLEKIDYLVSKRREIAQKYLKAIKETKCDWLIPQKVPKGYNNSYWTLAIRYEGEEKLGVSWYDFRKKFMEFGGDGIYASWVPLYKEPVIKMLNRSGKYFPGFNLKDKELIGFANNIKCPNTEKIQPQLMQFTTNQGIEKDMKKQVNALKKAIEFFTKKNETKIKIKK